MLNNDDLALEGEGSDGRYFPAEDDPHLCPRGYSYVDPLVGDGSAALVFYGAEGAGDDGFIGFYGPWQKALILLKGPGDAYFGSSQVAFALGFQLQADELIYAFLDFFPVFYGIQLAAVCMSALFPGGFGIAAAFLFGFFRVRRFAEHTERGAGLFLRGSGEGRHCGFGGMPAFAGSGAAVLPESAK